MASLLQDCGRIWWWAAERGEAGCTHISVSEQGTVATSLCARGRDVPSAQVLPALAPAGGISIGMKARPVERSPGAGDRCMLSRRALD